MEKPKEVTPKLDALVMLRMTTEMRDRYTAACKRHCIDRCQAIRNWIAEETKYLETTEPSQRVLHRQFLQPDKNGR